MLGVTARPIPPAAGEDLEIVRPDKIVPGRQIRNELWGGPNHPHPAQAEIALAVHIRRSALDLMAQSARMKPMPPEFGQCGDLFHTPPRSPRNGTPQPAAKPFAAYGLGFPVCLSGRSAKAVPLGV